MRRQKARFKIGLFSIGFLFLVLFQNCGPGFQVAINRDSASQAESTDAGQPVEKQFKKVSSYGTTRGCLITESNTVKCWGSNAYGQLGNNSFVDSALPVEVQGLNGIKQIANSTYHNCAITAQDTVKCWGQGNFGALGNAVFQNSPTPVDVLGLNDVLQLSLGDNSSCALTKQGFVKCWGHAGFGQLGNGTTTNSSVPVDVVGLTDVKQIAHGGYHVCALLAGGNVRCWGTNGLAVNQYSFVNSLVPSDLAGASSVKAIASGYHTTYILTDDDRLSFFGDASTPTTPVPVSSTELVKSISTEAERRSQSGQHGICWQTYQDTFKCFDNMVGILEIDGVLGIKHFSRACYTDQNNVVKCWNSNSLTASPSITTFDE